MVISKIFEMNTKCNSRISFTDFLPKWFFCICACTFTLCGFCKGQDIIYLDNNDHRNGKVIEITPEKVKYKNPENPGPVYSVNRVKVKLLFNENGSFLVMRKLDSLDAKLSEKLINDFINPLANKPEVFDKIFNMQHKQVNCKILNEDEKSLTIIFNDLEVKVDRSSLVAIVYKDGKHQLITDVAVTAEVLSNFITSKAVANKIEQYGKNVSTDKKIDLVIAEKNIEKSIKKVEDVLQYSNDSLATVLLKENKKLNDALKKLKADSIADSIIRNKDYVNAMAKGSASLRKGDYENALKAYLLASSIYPMKIEPKNQLEIINNKIQIISDSIYINMQYDSLITMAVNLQVVDSNWKEWQRAIAYYKNALALKPSDYYCQKQISYLEKQLAIRTEEERILEEKRKKAELEKRFQNLLEKAEIAAKDKNYQEALAAYKEALVIHAENDYVIARVKIMEFQVSKLKDTSDNKKTNY